jgi:hypothetical protein
MQIYIPTYRRAYEQATYGQIPPNWRPQTTFVADESDAQILRNRYAAHGCEVLVHPPEVRTIAAKRAWILANTPHEKIVMFDDDLAIFTRDPNSVALKTSKPEEVDTALRELSHKLNDLAHAGWSARRGNNHGPYGWAGNGRMMYCLGYRPSVLRRLCELGRIEHREDMDYTLQLLRKGFPNAVDFRYAVGDAGYNTRGGCRSQRTVEASDADALKLAELHPGFVKVVEKKYKGSLNRKEVVCAWKKAYEAGNGAGA